jgi:hypothetical protein
MGQKASTGIGLPAEFLELLGRSPLRFNSRDEQTTNLPVADTMHELIWFAPIVGSVWGHQAVKRNAHQQLVLSTRTITICVRHLVRQTV